MRSVAWYPSAIAFRARGVEEIGFLIAFSTEIKTNAYELK